MTTLVELFAPKGSVTEERRRRLGERLVTELISAPGAPADLVERGRAISWLVVHEPEVWIVGGRRVDASEPPRFIVRVSVPGGHLNDAMRAEMVARITRVLAEDDADPQRLYRDPDAWVQIIEVPDGNIGAFGRVMSTADITGLVVHGAPPEQTAPAGNGHGDALAVDPICGMTVAPTDDAIAFARDGVTYFFCSEACRDLFAGRAEAARGD